MAQYDGLLQSVCRYVMTDWPNKNKDKQLKVFFNCRHDLSMEQGCLMRGHKLIIPVSLRERVLSELHRAHFGVNKTKTEARSLFWWPQIDRDIELMISECPVCRQLKPVPARAPLTPWPFPPVPWYRVHLDFFGPLQGKMFLVIVDAYTKWIECFPLNSGYGSAVVIEKLYEVMSRFGIINTLVSDNGTSFTSQQFKDFCKLNGITHLTSPTYSPASNGQAEIAVKIVKKHLKGLCLQGKTMTEINSRLSEFLFRYRNSKHTTTDKSPAELMFGRPLRTRLDLLKPNQVKSPSSSSSEELRKVIDEKQSLQIKYYLGNRNIQLKENDTVLIKLHSNNKWVKGVIIKMIGNSLYDVYVPEINQIIKKHINQIHKLRQDKREESSGNSMDNRSSEREQEELPYWALWEESVQPDRQPMAPDVTVESEEDTPLAGPSGIGSTAEEPANEGEEWAEADPGLETDDDPPEDSTANNAGDAPADVANTIMAGRTRRNPRVDYTKYC